MNSQSKGLSMLGLAMKAGKVSSGEFATEQAVKSGSAYLVILAETASANTQKKFRNMCAYYKVPCILLGTKSSLEEPSEENTVLPLPYVKRILQKK